MDDPVSLPRRAVAEAVGTAFLLAAVVGSGIMAERLFPQSTGLALLANTIATACALFALIVTFAAVSGAHFNPAVTFASVADTQMPMREVPTYLAAQISGAVAGVAVANLMFDLPAFSLSAHVRTGTGQMLGEFVATFGLVMVIRGSSPRGPSNVAQAVAAWIAAGYWFTSSTSFANPAVTIARSLSDTFAGIRPTDVPAFVAAQLAGAAAATALLRWLASGKSSGETAAVLQDAASQAD